jgi:antitoxin VapB
MTMNIKNQETHDLARELAELTGQSVTQAVTTALRAELERVRHDQDKAERLANLLELAEDMRSRMKPEFFEIDHGDLLYDEQGLPR